MEFVLGVLLFVIGIAASIALHELGHMVPAKAFGVRVSQYMVGFGKTLWSRERGETEYGVKLIPLGGYVRLVGMMPPATEVKEIRGGGWAAQLIRDSRDVDNESVREGEEHRAFYRLAWWKKVIVMLGGPLMNLVIAAVLFVVLGSVVGAPQTVPVVSSVTACAIRTLGVDCEPGDPPSAAELAGIQPGDRLISVDGVALDSWEEITARVRDALGGSVEIGVERAGEVFTVVVTPTSREYYTFDADGNVITDADGEYVLTPTGFFGVAPGSETTRLSVGESLQLTGQNVALVVGVVAHLPEHVVNAAQAIAGTEERAKDGPVSIVGAAAGAGEVFSLDAPVSTKLTVLLWLLGAINIALFVFNMIPLLPLDGGHIASALWQAIKNGWARVRGAARPAPVDVARLMPLTYGVFAVLIAVGLVLIIADVVVPVQVV